MRKVLYILLLSVITFNHGCKKSTDLDVRPPDQQGNLSFTLQNSQLGGVLLKYNVKTFYYILDSTNNYVNLFLTGKDVSTGDDIVISMNEDRYKRYINLVITHEGTSTIYKDINGNAYGLFSFGNDSEGVYCTFGGYCAVTTNLASERHIERIQYELNWQKIKLYMNSK